MKYFLLLILALTLSGCGITVPQLNEQWEAAILGDKLAENVKASIYCEFRHAVADLGSNRIPYLGRDVDLVPDNWGAQITITLQVDENTAVSPSLTLNHTLPGAIATFPNRPSVPVPQSFNLPFSARVSSQATRIDKYDTFYILKNFKKPVEEYESCAKRPSVTGDGYNDDIDRSGTTLLYRDLGIASWMKGAFAAAGSFPSSDLPKNNPLKSTAMSYDIRFVVITDGSINPTWRLIGVSTGTGSLPLLASGRTRTHQMLLTIGPTEPGRSKELTAARSPSQATANLHLTGQIQQAIASGFTSALTP
ncbi:hypothetical protein [Methylobacterium goesingense]|uniref:Lipoprotein n=1 Tax=Methylobacterium goesingense TaxID=243690 RepID=A0ABV2LCN6_9HYPH|nr:hypothetical protein [Methylobacterium goesingense]GJD74133.1 hypothetical protein CFIICLFH_2367 [Methylobacterium goesingense]